MQKQIEFECANFRFGRSELCHRIPDTSYAQGVERLFATPGVNRIALACVNRENVMMRKLLFALGFLFVWNTAFAGPITLLDCSMEFAPIRRAILFELQGRLILATSDYDGELVSRNIPESAWETRIIPLVDRVDMKGILFKRDGIWNVTFKGENGWYLSGGASCSEGP